MEAETHIYNTDHYYAKVTIDFQEQEEEKTKAPRFPKKN